jgi:hypothetical protein
VFVAALVSACGPPPPVVVDPTLPDRLVGTVADPVVIDVDIQADDDLTEAVARVAEVLAIEGFEPFDPRAANRHSGAETFARYLTFQQPQPGPDVHHVVFVSVGPWTVERSDRFVRAFYAMPVTVPEDVGVPTFHFVGSHEPPFGVQWLFSGTWYGALEADALDAFAQLEPSPDTAPEWVDTARSVLARYGVPMQDDGRDLERLDALVAALPPAEPGSTWVPIGTLTTLGVLLGDAVIAERDSDDLQWIDATPSMATLLAIGHVTWDDVMLRPIDFVLDAWRGAIGAPFTGYVTLVEERLDALEE